MEYIKNEDGTYRGIKIIDAIDEKGRLIKDVRIEYPRLRITKWIKNVEFGVPLDVEVLASLNINSEEATIFTFNDGEMLP